MQVSDTALSSFESWYLESFGIKLTDEDAQSLSLEFLNVFKLFYRPVLKKEASKLGVTVAVYEIQ